MTGVRSEGHAPSSPSAPFHRRAYLALFLALGGTSYAALKLPADSVGPRQLKAGAVSSPEVKNRSLRAGDFAPGTLHSGLTGAMGSQGPAGARGPAGANGLDGTARAYARVTPTCSGSPAECGFDLAKGITRVVRVNVGEYCITAPGLSSQAVRPVTTVDWGTTNSPETPATTMIESGAGCPKPSDFGVLTGRPNGNNTANAFANDIGFTVVIP
jgi:hypothetical protein